MIYLKKAVILSVFVVLLMYPVYIFAYEGGTNNYHIELVTQELGAITVYIPFNYADCFTIEGTKIINQTSSNITGYIAGLSGTIRFSPFSDNPQYQQQYQWTDLHVSSIHDYNLPVLRSSDFNKFGLSRLSPYFSIILVVGVLCLIFIRR